MRYRFIAANRATWPVRLMCRVLGASPGGSSGWRRRPASPSARRRAALVGAIKAVPGEVKARYGSPRIRAERVARGRRCRANTMAKLMRRHGIAAKAGREYRCTTDSDHDRPVAGDVLDRRSEPGAADRAWTADITSVPTRAGWMDLAAVGGLHTRRIVGWSLPERIGSRLVVDAPGMAIVRGVPGAGLVAHADRGSQYASEHYRPVLTAAPLEDRIPGDDPPLDLIEPELAAEPRRLARPEPRDDWTSPRMAGAGLRVHPTLSYSIGDR